MKDYLVEFNENGAVVHKDPAIINIKKGLPFCFLNPNLSKISGISPSYWTHLNGEIVPVSEEERKRRDEHHVGKPPEPVVSLKDIIDELNKKLNKFDYTIEKLNKQLIVYKIALAISLILSLVGVFK